MTASEDPEAIRAALDRIDPAVTAQCVREVTGDLIAQFAEVSGDHHRLHLDAEYAAATPVGRRIAHGAMLVGFMSNASTILSETLERQIGRANVSLGYDRLRFIAPVFEGDTITTRIRIAGIDRERLRVICEQDCLNQAGETVAIAQHLMRFV
jgi:acyl dehydratase